MVSKLTWATAFVGGIVAALPTGGQAAIVANFTGGTGTVSSDQYKGLAGNGWAGAWGATATVFSGTVVNTSPLNNGGNYLNVLNSDVTTGDTSGQGVYRVYSNYDNVSLTAPHQIRFDFRLDSPASQLTGSGDQIIFVNSTSAALGGSNGYGIWTVYNNNELKWGWRNGTSPSVVSTMAVTTGTMYSFTIDLDPAALKYRVSISNGTDTVTSNLVGYRGTTQSLSTLMFWSKDVTAPSDPISFSLDNIAIVPEPAIGSLLLMSGVGLLGTRRRMR